MEERARVTYRADEGVATITLSSPETRNAITVRLQGELEEILELVATDPDIRVVVITGAGKAFSAGVDLNRLRGDSGRGAVEELRRLQRLVMVIRSCRKPVVAAVDGPAIGGGFDLALACDIRLASASAYFAESFVRFGLFPGTGGTYFLPQIVGVSAALDLIWTGRCVDATEALRLGLVRSVSDDGQLDDDVAAYTRQLAAGPPIAMAMAKDAVYMGMRMNLDEALRSAAIAETVTLGSADHAEGLEAYEQRRDPEFRGA